MRVFIMRHGPAEVDSPSGRDFDRALSPGGRRQTEALVRAFAHQGEPLDRVATSPLVRTVQTAELVVAALTPPPRLTVHDELAPGENLHGVVAELRKSHVASLLLVAHAPDVSLLASVLLGRHVGSFEPAMIVGIELEGATGRELFVLRPSALAP
jgi:phosphohistidine phosphatase